MRSTHDGFHSACRYRQRIPQPIDQFLGGGCRRFPPSTGPRLEEWLRSRASLRGHRGWSYRKQNPRRQYLARRTAPLAMSSRSPSHAPCSMRVCQILSRHVSPFSMRSRLYVDGERRSDSRRRGDEQVYLKCRHKPYNPALRHQATSSTACRGTRWDARPLVP